MPVRIGMVGLGVLSQQSLLPHLTRPDAKKKLNVIAVCDLDERRALLTAKKYCVPEYYTSLEEMLCSATIDAVLICTPIHLHYHHALASLTAGKHVYVQKTIATNLDNAQNIYTIAERHDRIIVASPLQMLNPARQAARQLIADGAIGPVFWALCVTNWPGFDFEKGRLGDDPLSEIDPSWKFKKYGGPVFDMTVYSLHTVTGLLGPVKRVTAFSGKRVPQQNWKGKEIQVESHDNTLLLLDFGENVFALVNGSSASLGRSIGWGHVSIFGANGTIEIYSDGSNESGIVNVVEVVGGKIYKFNDFGPYLPPDHIRLNDPHVYADIMYFVDCIRSENKRHSYAAQTCHVVEVIEKGYKAASTGQTQTIETSFKLLPTHLDLPATAIIDETDKV